MAVISNVDRIYNNIRAMTTSFALKPEEKLNEQKLAGQLGVSRTPLREALNRLVSEGFLTIKSGRGFYCRSLSAAEILDLYQSREAIECKLVELACARASPIDLYDINNFLQSCKSDYHEQAKGSKLVGLDEQFHLKIANLSGNNELIRMLDNLNARVRFVRTIDLKERRIVTPGNHGQILDAMVEGDVDRAVSEMKNHILRSYEEASEAVRQAFMQIYAPKDQIDEKLAGGG